MKGFVASPVIIIIIAILALGIVGYVALHKSPATAPQIVHQASPSAAIATPSASPIPSLKPSVQPAGVPLVDCVGPDGKHVSLTKNACDSFKKAWATPTPSPTATPQPEQASSNNTLSNGSCNPGGVTISLQANSGGLVGDAIIRVTVQSSPQCGSTYATDQILRQGSSSVSFSGLPPGTYNVFVTYHGNQYNGSFDVSSGGNTSKTVNVNN